MTWWCSIHIKYRIMGQFFREMETMSKNVRERKLCIHSKYYPFQSIQQHTIPVCLEASEHQFIIIIMFSFHNLFNASQGEMSSWGFLMEILFVYDCAVMWLQCPHSEVWLVLSCCYVFANVSAWCRLHATMWHVGSAAQALRKCLTRMRWHVLRAWWKGSVCICEGSVCVSGANVWLCASVSDCTIPRSWPVSQSWDVKTPLIWIFPKFLSQFYLKCQSNSLLSNMYSGSSASILLSFLPVVNYYSACLHVHHSK